MTRARNTARAPRGRPTANPTVLTGSVQSWDTATADVDDVDEAVGLTVAVTVVAPCTIVDAGVYGVPALNEKLLVVHMSTVNWPDPEQVKNPL